MQSILSVLLSVGGHFDGSGSAKLVCEQESFPETSSQLEYYLWCNTGTAQDNIWLSDNPVEVLNEHLSLLVGGYVPTNVIRVRHKDKTWFDDQCMHASGFKQEALFGLPVIALG